MLGTNLRCLDNLNGIGGFDISNSLQTTSIVYLTLKIYMHNIYILLNEWIYVCTTSIVVVTRMCVTVFLDKQIYTPLI